MRQTEMRKQLVIRTETTKDGESFIRFFRELEGKKWAVLDVGLVGLTPRNTKSIFLRVTD